MTEDEFNNFVTHIADAAFAYDHAMLHEAGPVVSCKYEPDADGFSRIEVGLRWLERMPIEELEGDELASETARRTTEMPA